MPKSEGESILLALSWQVVQDNGLRNNVAVAGGSRLSHSIAGTFNGSPRVPRVFAHTATSAFDDADVLHLPLFALSAWGIPLPAPSSEQQPLQQPIIQQEPQPKQLEQQHSAAPREQLRSLPTHPPASAIKEAESFFGNSYRPLTPKPAASSTSSAGASELPLSAGSKRPAPISYESPPKKERLDALIVQSCSLPLQSELPIQLQQQQQQRHHDRRHWPWARQLDPSYLQR